MWRKCTWCLAIIIIIIFSAEVLGQEIDLKYPSKVNLGEVFQINLTLINFSIDLYDIKIDITNNNGQRIAKIFNGQDWQSTYNYINSIINSSKSNSSSFLLNITEIYNGTANLEVKIRNKDTLTFEGYNLIITQIILITANQSQNTTQNNSQVQNSNIYLELEYDDTVENGKDFEVKVKAYNLEDKYYDIKAYLTFEENDTVISEIYDEGEDKWKSSTYYITNATNGKGNKTETFDLRIKEDYRTHIGEAKIYVKIRETISEDIISEESGTIEIKENTDNNLNNYDETDNQENTDNLENEQLTITGNEIIQLNPPQSLKTSDVKKITSYKSKIQYIKDYAIYVFAFLCILIIIYLLNHKIINKE